MTQNRHIDSQVKLLGKRLKWARELVEPNRTEFARSLGVDHTTIRNIENGTRGPSIALLMMVCHSLRISFEYLVHGELRGVDGELAALLTEHHPELKPRPELGRDRLRTGGQGSTVHGAMTPADNSQTIGR